MARRSKQDGAKEERASEAAAANTRVRCAKSCSCLHGPLVCVPEHCHIQLASVEGGSQKLGTIVNKAQNQRLAIETNLICFDAASILFVFVLC